MRSDHAKGMLERVTGSLRFLDDLPSGGMLHGRCVTVQAARSRIHSIHTKEALKMPGVVTVYTANELGSPCKRFGPLIADRPVLAEEETKFEGEPVALVLAETYEEATAAASAVEVDFTTLPAIITLEDATAPGAPLVQPPDSRPKHKWRETNVMDEWEFGWGNPEDVASGVSLIVRHTYHTPFLHHFALEPYSVIATPEKDGIKVYAAIQHPFPLRRVLSEMLGLPESKVRVVATEMGGGFGGRGYPKIEPLATLAALASKRPVKISLTSNEGFYQAQREASCIKMCTGFREDGKMLFQEAEIDFLVGAYADISPRVVQKAGYLGAGPYRVEHAKILARGVFSHTPPTTAYRGFGATHVCFAVESQMNDAALRLGLDPVEIRRRNLPQKGDVLVPGDSPVDGDWIKALEKAAHEIGWHKPKISGRGRGIAIGIKSPVPGTVSEAKVVLYKNALATVFVGTTEMGQGAKSVMARLATQRLGLSFEKVQVILGDTGQVPFDALTASSRSTVMMGSAVYAACDDVRDQLKRMASALTKVDVTEVQIHEGTVHAGERSFTYEELLRSECGPIDGEIIGRGRYRGEKREDHPLGGPAAFWELIVTGVEVEVDPELGHIQLHNLVSVSDVGKLINPLRAAGQDEGGAVMAIGAALMEQILLGPSGLIQNANALDYKIPTCKDIPLQMESYFQENADGPGPNGSKGLGESGILAPLPAICGAIFDSCGVFVDTIPITPEKFWGLLHGYHRSKTITKSQEREGEQHDQSTEH
jgi:CO/xanthine dehydrogenase Mo-binding subunit